MSSNDDRDRGIGWVIERLTPPEGNKSVEPLKKSYSQIWGGFGAFKVRICDRCDRIWDWRSCASDFITVLFYDDFPRYGLDTETCLECDPSGTKMKSRKKIRTERI